MRSKTLPTILCLGTFGLLPLTAAAQQGEPPDAQVLSDAQHQLKGKQFRDVQETVANGVVTLTGNVNRLEDKLDAAKRIDHTHEAVSIDNQITVNVPPGISDAELFQKLGKDLAYDRESYPSYPFNSMTLQVHDGVVTLGGEVVEPVDKDSAVSLIASTPGVRGLVDHLQVAPLSPADWRLRRALYTAIYGTPQLNRYAIDPSKPIRIVVVNGNVVLTGVVLNKGDREIAGLRANGVSGAFSVKNDIQTEEGGQEH